MLCRDLTLEQQVHLHKRDQRAVEARRGKQTMMTLEEKKILTYLQKHIMAPVGEITRTCIPGGSPEWATRILWNLEWLGYVVRYEPDAVQITERGVSLL